MNAFFDRCVGVAIARMLHGYSGKSHPVIHLDDDPRFTPTSTDVDIITTVSADSPARTYFTADQNNRIIEEERAALKGSGMCVVFLKKGFNRLDFHVQAVKILTLWPEIIKLCDGSHSVSKPTAYEISPGGNKPVVLGLTKDL